MSEVPLCTRYHLDELHRAMNLCQYYPLSFSPFSGASTSVPGSPSKSAAIKSSLRAKKNRKIQLVAFSTNFL